MSFGSKRRTPGVAVVLRSLVASTGLHVRPDGSYTPALPASKGVRAARKRQRVARREGRR